MCGGVSVYSGRSTSSVIPGRPSRSAIGRGNFFWYVSALQRGLLVYLNRTFGVVAAALAVSGTSPALAQLSYQPGQVIQFLYFDEWKDAEFIGPTPDGNQAFVRMKNALGGVFVLAVAFNKMRAQPAQKLAGESSAPQAAQAGETAIRSAPAPAQVGGPPRSGDYPIKSYGNPRNPLPLGRINLSGNTYRFYSHGGKLLGEGQYSFAAGSVTWRTGILKSYGWGGALRIDRGGRDHVIILNYTTFATNSR